MRHFFSSALRLLIFSVPLAITIAPSIASAQDRFSRDVQCQAEAIQYYFAVIDLQEGIAKKDSTGPTFTSFSIILGSEIAAKLESQYDEIKESVWELPHFKEMDKNQTGILIYEECLQLGAAAPVVQEVNTTGFFNGELLNTNQRYLESVIGIPLSSYGNQHEFKVQGCDITATIDDDNVSALHMRLSDKCRPDLRTFIGGYAPPPNRMLTAGALVEASGGGMLKYSADCLTLCGNAYDPSVYAHWSGPRAVGFIDVVMEVTLVGDDAINASNAWKEHMTQAMGEDYVLDTRFNCDNHFDVAANNIFKNIEVTGITIGHGLETPDC